MIEKDTIQSMFLFELAKSELPFVFKGGTSLSKAYNLIDRKLIKRAEFERYLLENVEI
ncbi:MAG: nucleotidyl transferase AbiEii/AbiGii toxin family protein [Kineothrix sp.]